MENNALDQAIITKKTIGKIKDEILGNIKSKYLEAKIPNFHDEVVIEFTKKKEPVVVIQVQE